MKRIFLLVLLILSLMVTLLSGCSATTSESSETTEVAQTTKSIDETETTATEETTEKTVKVGPLPGNKAPDFTLLDIEGNEVSLSDFSGKTIVLNFFASWCGPCQYEAGSLVKLSHDHADQNVQVISVNLTGSTATEGEDVLEFVDEFGLDYPVLLDTSSEIAMLYRVNGIPTNVFIDADGLIVTNFAGALTEEQFAEFLSQAVE